MLKSTFRKLIGLLTPRARRQFYLLLGMIAFMGLAEMLSVAAVLPFLAVVANPGMLEGDGRLAGVYAALGFADRDQFLVLLGGGIFGLVVFGLLFSTLTHYAIYRFAGRQGYSISSRLLRGYLAKPYTWFLDHHSANLGASVLGEVQHVVAQALVPSMKLLSQAVVALFLITLLVVARPLVALVAGSVVVGCYLVIYAAVRGRLIRLGRVKHEATRARFRIAADALGGIKDVKLMGLEETYMRRFGVAARQLELATASHNIIAELPRNILKAVALGGILFFVVFLLVTTGGNLSEVLPILGLYAFASLRLFPALQVIYASTAKLRFAQPVLDKLHADMRRNPAPPPAAAGVVAPLGLTETLELADVHYAYPKAERAAVTGLSLTVPALSTVGLVGGTGAGKTTVVDVILGLLRPERGALEVDGVPVAGADLRAWQNSVGYVPQQIFLIDDTVSANIAFGLPPERVDQAAVERAAKIAELHEFVTTEMPKGYETLVGERGVRLSGGQRQRIGIARALYHDPAMLILDEATSALDNLTERAVMDAIRNLGRSKTIVMIAHRLTTVRDCDVIFMLERGQVVASGSYEELMETSGKFRSLAGA